MISSINATKNGKRAALIHLYFNIIGVVIVLSLFYILNAIFKFTLGDVLFVDATIDMWGVALVHTVFKIISVAIISPFYRQLEKLARISIKDKENENETVNLLDERLIETPAFAVERATEVTHAMANVATDALKKSLLLFDAFDPKLADEIRVLEDKGDIYEDALGSYLVKISNADVSTTESSQITKLLHIIGDFERISDHAVNIVESAEEIRERDLHSLPRQPASFPSSRRLSQTYSLWQRSHLSKTTLSLLPRSSPWSR
jgi:phosphate:Na+ symporter